MYFSFLQFFKASLLLEEKFKKDMIVNRLISIKFTDSE